MRVFLIVLAVLVLLITALMLSGIVVEVSFRSCKLTWCVKYLGIKILPRSPKKEAPVQEAAGPLPDAETQEALPDEEALPPEEETAAEKKPKKRRHKPPKPGKEEPAPEEKTVRKPFFMDRLWEKLQDLAEKMDMAGSGLHALPGPLKKLLRGVKLYDIDTDIVTAHEEADKCAELYALVTGGLHSLLGHLSLLMKVRRRDMRIVCDFAADECRFDFSFRVRVRIGAAVGAGIWFLWVYFYDHHFRRTKSPVL